MAEAFDELMTIPYLSPILPRKTRLSYDGMFTGLWLSLKPRAYCTKEWEKAWTSESGVLGALMKEELPGSEIHDKLETYAKEVGNFARKLQKVRESSKKKHSGLTIQNAKFRITPENEALKLVLKIDGIGIDDGATDTWLMSWM
ncbi:hypothetical protein B0H11DRAFT_1939405 [Mycena galericulata]|nr:hypothetical protein B0H11DRAFT_1939405 [Mycena galericulata]